MPDGLDWLLRPVTKGMCLFESLKNGAINLEDIALMNDALDVIAINASKAQQHNENQNGR